MKTRLASADPHAGYQAARAEIDAAIARVLASGTYIHGPELAAFENEFANWLGTSGCVGVANGTDALELALRALGVGAGDRVLTVANTVTATAAAIVAVGAEPVFVEIEADTMLMDMSALEERLRADSARVRAIIPVHLYGQACDMPRLMELAEKHGLHVVEDCAQAHGATVNGRKAGAWGALSAFSFYPTKNLGALGDAGAVVGNDSATLERVRRLRQYGWRTRYVSEEPGRNSRLDEIQAAILRVQLQRLDAGNAQRARLANRYLSGLAGIPGLRPPAVAAGRGHVWHQFVVRTPQRGALKARLEAESILCGVLYPVPVYRQPGYAQSDVLSVTEEACARVISLPLHPAMSDADVDRVVIAVRAALV
jgi:dTDP-4-amino-4,6-dideoxygalactose transaminase